MLDILIRGGLVVDGTGSEPFAADVAVEDGVITGVGSLPGAQARRVIDATGLIVCPGLIDPHSHSDRSILGNPTAQSTIRQGVTTEVVGNCGATFAPLGPASAAVAASALAALGYEGPVDWRGFSGLLERVGEIGTSQRPGVVRRAQRAARRRRRRVRRGKPGPAKGDGGAPRSKRSTRGRSAFQRPGERRRAGCGHR